MLLNKVLYYVVKFVFLMGRIIIFYDKIDGIF